MSNRAYGSVGGWNFNCAELLTESKQLRPGDSGKIWFCEANTSENVIVNLPTASELPSIKICGDA